MDAMTLTEPCPVCGGHEHRFFAERNDCRLWRCEGCRLVFQHPPVTPELATALYQDACDGATTRYFTKVERKLQRSRGRARRLARHVTGGAKGKRFLDIGCNGGFMTEAARELSFAATGLDPDGPSLDWARAHYPRNDYIHGLFEDAPIADASFDAIYCSEVIEHVADANRFVARLAAVLAPGGIVFLTTPDIDHWRRPRAIEKWDAYCPPAHCLYFNPRNLARLLAAHGLTVIWRAISFKPGIKLIARKDGAPSAASHA